MPDPKTLDIKDFVPREGEARPLYSAKDFDGDVDPARDDFNEGLTLPDINTEPMFINIGPTHPATHGTFRVYCQLDGETVQKAGVDIGYLHRGFEKIVEIKHYNQVIPYTDRLNYCSGLTNNIGYCKAVERMMGLEVPPRTIMIRVIIMEIQRIMDHMICCGANIVDIGALTNFWYFFNAREKLNDAAGGAHRRPPHLQLHARRRPGVGPARRLAREREGGHQGYSEGHRRRAWPHPEEPHLPGPHARGGRDRRGRCHELRVDGTHAARHRRRPRPAQDAALLRLRELRFRRSGGYERRRVTTAFCAVSRRWTRASRSSTRPST